MKKDKSLNEEEKDPFESVLDSNETEDPFDYILNESKVDNHKTIPLKKKPIEEDFFNPISTKKKDQVPKEGFSLRPYIIFTTVLIVSLFILYGLAILFSLLLEIH